MPDWQGTTGRDDLVGGDNRVRVHLDGPCTHQDRHVCPECAGLTKAEVAALRDYFALHPNHYLSPHRGAK